MTSVFILAVGERLQLIERLTTSEENFLKDFIYIFEKSQPIFKIILICQPPGISQTKKKINAISFI